MNVLSCGSGGQGYRSAMTDNSELRNDAAPNEAVQAVVDRVLSWHAGGEPDLIRSELEKGLAETGESVPDEWVQQMTQRIHQADPAQK